jgi:precorrin-6A/cobalt-precorrin-6A reductase
MILLLAGTTEGRKMADGLHRQGFKVLAATATVYGKELLSKTYPGQVIAGPLTLDDLLMIIKEKAINRVVDATHPYATQITYNAQEACRITGIAYERVERETSGIKADEGIIPAVDTVEAAHIAAKFKGTVFLTTGSSKLEDYTKIIAADRLVVRILPVRESLDKCLKLGILPANIVAMQGPFDYKTNKALFLRYDAAVIISKESGPQGGVKEKIDAAASLNIPVILISRPSVLS